MSICPMPKLADLAAQLWHVAAAAGLACLP